MKLDEITDNCDVSIVIPVLTDRKIITNFNNQTFRNFELIVSLDEKKKGSAYARNRGVEFINKEKTKYILFSDDDIIWAKTALEEMIKTLEEHLEASYCYCAFQWDTVLMGNKEFNSDELKKGNYISVNSLIRVKDFTPFDENLKRLVDWDLWLTLLEQNKVGVYCGKVLFKTVGKTISGKGEVSYEEAYTVVKEKHKL